MDQTRQRRVRRRLLPDADRPSSRRPQRRPSRRSRRHRARRPPRPQRRRSTRRRSPTSCGAPPTRPARTTATSPAWPCCSPGLPLTVPGATVNRLCGSGLDALNRAAADLALGHGDVGVAGGVEAMSRAPFVLPRATDRLPRTQELVDSALGWRLVNPRMPDEHTISLGMTAEVLAAEYSISREAQDRFAVAQPREGGGGAGGGSVRRRADRRSATATATSPSTRDRAPTPASSGSPRCARCSPPTAR